MFLANRLLVLLLFAQVGNGENERSARLAWIALTLSLSLKVLFDFLAFSPDFRLDSERSLSSLDVVQRSARKYFSSSLVEFWKWRRHFLESDWMKSFTSEINSEVFHFCCFARNKLLRLLLSLFLNLASIVDFWLQRFFTFSPCLMAPEKYFLRAQLRKLDARCRKNWCTVIRRSTIFSKSVFSTLLCTLRTLTESWTLISDFKSIQDYW